MSAISYPKHFLSIENLPKQVLLDILSAAETYLAMGTQKLSVLSGTSIANLFYESSTRTRTTFEIAAKRLGADITNFNIAVSSTSKGETLLDTIRNLQAMQIDMFIVRHNSSGAAEFIAQHITEDIAILNAGDGQHEHPTQAMLDMLTILKYKKQFAGLKIAIVGDILHSRVARSQIHALKILGVEDIRVVAPKTLLPVDCEALGARVFYDLHRGLKDADVVIMLRLQNERMQHGLLPSKTEYYHTYGLTPERLAYANPEAIVMHPGPINRGVEIASSVADGAQSVILKQVQYGIPVRMAVMSLIMGKKPPILAATSKVSKPS